MYFVRVTGADEQQRNAIIEKMAERGVSANVHYKPLPMLSAYKKLGFDIANYPNAFALYHNEITMPLFSIMTDEQCHYAAKVLLEATEEVMG